MTFVAPCLFGLESVLANELKALGAENVRSENGRVLFDGDLQTLATANIGSRVAERILIVLAQFPARTFEELFQGVRKAPLEDFIGATDAFPVKGWSLHSQLHSIPDCQSIIKKAAVERLRSRYRIDWFQETGPVHQLQFSILKDEVTLMLDTSGEGLHKRGYRPTSNAAPIKETLAAGMLEIARVRRDNLLLDPFCGSGTFLIEGALRARNIAPGIRRPFAAERFGDDYRAAFGAARAAARNAVIQQSDYQAIGSDIDPAAVDLTLYNARQAGVAGTVRAKVQDVADFVLPEWKSTVVTNPPYGERLGDQPEAQRLIRLMGERFPVRQFASYYIISPDEDFETLFGRKADKRRKLYNGMLRCQMYSYFRW